MQPVTRLFALFALSGFAGIIYESIWSHYLKLFLGHAAYAQTTVLVIFMGGLALGSWLGAKLEKSNADPLTSYVAIEIGIGTLGLLFHPIFIAVTRVATNHVFPLIENPFLVHLVKTGVAAGLLLPPSILLGMTFPLMTVGLIRRGLLPPGFTISNLYFVNSLGAGVGVLVSGFLLIDWFGLPGTIRFAAAMNIFVALCVFLLTRTLPQTLVVTGSPPGTGPARSPHARLILVAAGLTGCASFIYEISWIRMLNMVLGTSTHSFELMLSAFIIGLAVGGRWIRGHLDRDLNWLPILALIQLAMAVLAAATLPFYDFSFVLMSLIFHSVSSTPPGYGLYMLLSNGLAFLVMIPTTICAGMTLPIMTHYMLRSGHGNRAVGEIYAANTAGAIIGIVVAIHLLLPLSGLKAALLIGAGIDLLLGLYLLRKFASGRDPLAAACGALAFVVAVTLFINLDPRKMAAGVFRHGIPELAEESVMELHEDGKSASVAVFRIHNSTRVIATNGKPDASMQLDPELPPSSDENTQILISAVAMMLKPEMRNAAIIGIGSGMTTHVVLQNPALERADTIEIEAQMVAGARLFRPHVERTFADPRSRIHIEDARTYFATRGEKYDAILSEPSNPWVSGVSGLFTLEFYGQVKRHLKPGGIFAQWLQLYEIDLDLVASVFKAFATEFPDYCVFELDDGNLLLVAGAGNSGDFRTAAKRVLQMGEMKPLLTRIGIRTAGDLQSRHLANADLLQPLFENNTAPPNSDFRPFLDVNAAYNRFLGASTRHFGEFSRAQVPIREMLAHDTEPTPTTSLHDGSVYATLNAISAARVLRDWLLFGRGENTAIANESLTRAALLLKQETSCSEQAERKVRISAAVGIGAATLSLLPAAEARVLAQALLQAGCFSHEVDAVPWGRLLQAIAARDAGLMRDSAASLRTHADDKLVERYATMLLQALFLGNIMLGAGNDNAVIWEGLDAAQRTQMGNSVSMSLLRAHSATTLGPRQQQP